MNKLKLIALTLILFQSCQVYKPIGINEVENGKRYKITHKNGQTFDAKCQGINDENILVIVNEKELELPKSKVEKVEKQKASLVRLIGGVTLATVGAVIIIRNGDKETFLERTVN